MVKEEAHSSKLRSNRQTDEVVDPVFGISKMYATKSGGEEWFMKYDSIQDLRDDERVQNWQREGDLRRHPNNIWESSGGKNGQFRIEAWSPKKSTPAESKKARWLNVEITAYCRITQKRGDPRYAWQLYSRGGHHSENRPCEGSALKGRWWNLEGSTSVVKELCHSAYTDNTAKRTGIVPNNYGDGSWYGSKLVIYNIKQNGITYTKQEVYTDPNADENGNLVIRNGWQLATSFIDRGRWFVSAFCFGTDCERDDERCGRQRDEILTDPGGDKRERSPFYNRNLVALRSDQVTIQFAYFSAREIDHNEPIAAKEFRIKEEEKQQLPAPPPTGEGDDENGEIEEPGVIVK